MSVLEQAQIKLQRTGLLVKTERSGVFHQNPLLMVIAAAFERVSRGLREFGLTPSSRSRIVVPPRPSETRNKWEELRRYGEEMEAGRNQG
jgi:P27 family predicted phage terminase small subunit